MIIIPINGIGNRFKSSYNKPKALIEVSGKPIICWLLDNLKPNNNLIYIPYNYNEYSSYNFENFIINLYPNYNFKFLKLFENTIGCASTLFIALNHLFNEGIDLINEPVISIDVDNFYTIDIIKLWNGENKIFSFKDYNLNNPNFSYIKLNNNYIDFIKEKEFINDIDFNFASCGAYGFQSAFQLLKFTQLLINNDNLKINNEFYNSSIINLMIQHNIPFLNHTLDNKDYFSLGTPEQVKKFEYIYLFDLDGTLIDTDNIYFNVWYKIFNDFYNYKIDKTFFNDYISGLADYDFLKSIIPDISDTDINKISNIKDELFLNYLKNFNFYEGSIGFLRKLQNTRIAIVTNSNKNIASFIINNSPLKELISILITADDCPLKKPNPLPYLKAINYLTTHNTDKIIVFEDSYNGYLSAKKANIKNIFIKNNNNYINFNDNNIVLFNNYSELNINNLFDNNDPNIHIIKEIIGNNLIQIKNNNNQQKTGYICQILSYKLINPKKEIDVIFKLPNFNNSLTNTANSLNLYNNEYVFYKYLSNMISNIINIPNCLGLYENNNGILMEDLTKKFKGSFNLNLNNNIELLLKVIKEISKLHNSFIIYNNNHFIYNKIKKINDFYHYKKLIIDRYDLFKFLNSKFISKNTLNILDSIITNFDNIINKLSSFPLVLAHGDLKSPNIFYKDNSEPYFLDFQYINLSKGTTDIIFLLCESIKFNKNITDIILNYYFLHVSNIYDNYYNYLFDVKLSLCCFPLFVCIWFNTEDINTLNDKSFPLRFMKNYFKYFEYLIDNNFLSNF
jgi:beta-phosphoglucomutase-like phosphatase (HAD superfamily)/choline kinase